MPTVRLHRESGWMRRPQGRRRRSIPQHRGLRLPAGDYDGNYSIQAEPNATLVFSYVGCNTQEVPVDGRTTINVNLATNTVAMKRSTSFCQLVLAVPSWAACMESSP